MDEVDGHTGRGREGKKKLMAHNLRSTACSVPGGRRGDTIGFLSNTPKQNTQQHTHMHTHVLPGSHNTHTHTHTHSFLVLITRTPHTHTHSFLVLHNTGGMDF